MVYDLTITKDSAFTTNANDKLINVPPGVWKVSELTNTTTEKYTEKKRTFELVAHDKLVNNRMSIPPIIYGDIMTFLKIVWNTYAISEKSEGTFFFGNSGMGKTDASNILANISLNRNLPVIIIESLTGDMDLVRYIDQLPDCCIIFEEFGKMFPYFLQMKMLSLFSSTGIKRLYVINDNDKNGICPFLLNRPGRITFKKEFSKLNFEVFEQYIQDHGVKKDTTFFDDMMKMYKTTTVLSMDHVKHIIKLHLQYKEFDLKYILSILNVDVLTKPVLYRVMEVKRVSDNALFKITRSIEIEKSQFDNGRDYYLTLDRIKEEPEVKPEASTTQAPNPYQMNSFNPGDRLMSFKLTNTRMIDSSKVFSKFEIMHNDEKFVVTLILEDE